ncbi:hypothetical protein AMECASPLE_031880 [Ameca splendens]|uniref:Uncharacterized protein n=1 Tax=Ameca splendens TaxID=208324 RepID=A0ABV1ADZ4_9TELE
MEAQNKIMKPKRKQGNSPQNLRSLRARWYQNIVSGLADTFSIPLGIEEPVKLRLGNETTPASSLVTCFHMLTLGMNVVLILGFYYCI